MAELYPGGQVVSRYHRCECCGGKGRHGMVGNPISCGGRFCVWCAGTGRVKELYRIPSGTRSLDAYSHAEASSTGRA